MKAKKITFENFRNIASAEVEFSPGVNVLWGENAQGKSNILEGIYYFSRGKSFRGVPDKLLIRTGEDFAEAELICRAEGDAYDTALKAVIPRTGRKRLTRGGAPLSGVKELVGSFRAVLFSPEHLALVSGSPAERRSFLDIAIAQLFPRYVSALTAYTRTLTERNALLRFAADGGSVSPQQWDVYAEQLARSGAFIAAARAAYTDRLSCYVAECFAEMTEGRETPCLTYTGIGAAYCTPPACDADVHERAAHPAPALAQAIYDGLCCERQREIAAGTTLHGVHRDDITISLNGEAAKLYASQGQTRSLALAMKLGEGALSRTLGGEEPVYLLDDVFSELDAGRRNYLLSALGERQVIITSCEPDTALSRLSEVSVFEVRAGTVCRA
ncbi:MAG: DNA replication/repair protein RecF [Ruminococcaceae bacterium]|nr:DNA replication/repair protein RecF [Oscillospiraceae bacterium]